jgi:hypothetical protein
MNTSRHILRRHSFRKHLAASLIALCAASFAYTTAAQDMDVDQADTIDFQSFHKDKKEAIKAWKNNSSDASKNAPVKAYEQTPATTATTTPAATGPATAVAPAALAADKAPAANTTPANKSIEATPKVGQRYEIRERYTLTRSTKTPYSAFYVIEPLYKQAAQLCPRGWKKLSERSEPIEQDFYLYYEIECL